MDNASLDLEGVQEPLAHKISVNIRFSAGKDSQTYWAMNDATIFVPCVLLQLCA